MIIVTKRLGQQSIVGLHLNNRLRLLFSQKKIAVSFFLQFVFHSISEYDVYQQDNVLNLSLSGRGGVVKLWPWRNSCSESS